MKKTCYNCKHYVGTLSDADDSFYHIHNWCKQWKRQLDSLALAGQFEYDGLFYDDLETGDACCYMFAAVDVPAKPDTWFSSNKQKNLESIIKG